MIKKKLTSIVIITVILALVFFKPLGIINFEKLAGHHLLIAQREGSANCLSTFKLKSNKNFTFNQFCFGSIEATGKYNIKDDTIFLNNIKPARGDTGFYEFAVITKEVFGNNEKIMGSLYLYRNIADTSPYFLGITLNSLQQ